MKTTLLLAVALLVPFLSIGQPRIVTIVQTTDNQTNTVDIADFEHAKILTARDKYSFSPSTELTIAAQGGVATWRLMRGYRPDYESEANPEGTVVAGPAQITITSGEHGSNGPRTPVTPVLVTLEIGPSAYPVTNSVTIGPWPGAEINLQSSTNLVQWTPATNGVYQADQAMFFRLFLRRLPSSPAS